MAGREGIAAMARRHGGDGAWMRLSAAACHPPLNALSHVLTKLAWGHKATDKEVMARAVGSEAPRWRDE
jgi:hypothetical protein